VHCVNPVCLKWVASVILSLKAVSLRLGTVGLGECGWVLVSELGKSYTAAAWNDVPPATSTSCSFTYLVLSGSALGMRGAIGLVDKWLQELLWCVVGDVTASLRGRAAGARGSKKSCVIVR
jgi:hypothetical protein